MLDPVRVTSGLRLKCIEEPFVRSRLGPTHCGCIGHDDWLAKGDERCDEVVWSQLGNALHWYVSSLLGEWPSGSFVE